MTSGQRVAGTLAVLRHLPREWRLPYLPRERVDELRDGRIRELAGYAAETVPYYRELFAQEGIDPREVRSPQELRSLPLIDKTIVQEAPERFRSTSPAGREALPFTTTGSSWSPLTVYRDRRSMLENLAHSERYRVVERRLVGKKLRYGMVMIGHEGAGRRIEAHYRDTTMRHLLSSRSFIPMGTPIERVVEQLRQLRPEVLAGLGSYLEEFFKLVARNRLSLPKPAVVRYGGDLMSAEGKELIEQHFGIPVLSNYSAVEAFKIGHFCEERRGFHLYEDLLDLWLAGPDGKPAAAGELGEVVISNLVNRGTVLLNYRLGDLARLSADGCPCGRTSRILSSLEGRVSQIVHLPSGDIVHPFVVLQTMRRHADVIRWQLMQHERDRFELKLATVDRAAYDRVAGSVAAEAREILQGTRVEVGYHESVDLGPGGKQRPVVALPPP
jgi:phenylacetate-CoA ligase